MLPTKTVMLAGHAVPYLEQMLAGEMMELERLALQSPAKGLSGLEQDIQTARILIGYRLGKTFEDPDFNKPLPFDYDELNAGLLELCEPFFEAQRKKAKRRRMAQIAALSAPALQSQIDQTAAVLSEMKRTLREKQRGSGMTSAA